MATLKKYDLEGKEAGEVAIEESLLDISCNIQVIKDYLMAIRKNARQWSANTQTRAEVNHSKRKPFAQKGTGNARQGFLGAPQFRGGGRVHAPKPKFDQHWKMNRKERRLAVRKLMSEKIKGQNAHILDYIALKTPKTKTLSNFLKTLNMSGKRILFLADSPEGEKYGTLTKSLSNLQKVEFSYFSDVNGYDLALCHEVIFLEPALEEVKASLGGKNKNA